MQSAYVWALLAVAVVLIVLVVALVVVAFVVVLRRRSPHAPVPGAVGAATTTPEVPRTLDDPGLSNFTPARDQGAPPSPYPEGRSLPTPLSGGELPQRLPNRPWPAAGMRELAAAARRGGLMRVLHGTVRGDDGTPLANAVLTIINVTGGQAGTAHTGADGGYQLTIPGDGAYVLIARGVNHEPHASTVEVQGAYTAFDIQLTSAAGLMGVVTDADGHGVPDATVIVTNTTGVVVSARRTNEQGGYTVTDLAAGLYTVTVAAEGYDPVATLVDVPPTGVVRQNVAFEPRRISLRGVAVHDVDGLPLADIRVQLLDWAGRPMYTVDTGPDGRYEFEDLDPGQYKVVAYGYPKVTSSVELAEREPGEHQVRLGHRPVPSERGGASMGVGVASSLVGENNGNTDEEYGR